MNFQEKTRGSSFKQSWIKNRPVNRPSLIKDRLGFLRTKVGKAIIQQLFKITPKIFYTNIFARLLEVEQEYMSARQPHLFLGDEHLILLSRLARPGGRSGEKLSSMMIIVILINLVVRVGTVKEQVNCLVSTF